MQQHHLTEAAAVVVAHGLRVAWLALGLGLGLGLGFGFGFGLGIGLGLGLDGLRGAEGLEERVGGKVRVRLGLGLGLGLGLPKASRSGLVERMASESALSLPEIWGDIGRYREIWGDMGRYGEM